MKLRLWSALAIALLTQGVNATYFAFRTDYPAVYPIAGFDWLSRLEVFRIFDGSGKTHAFENSGRKYSVSWDTGKNEVGVDENGKRVLVFALSPLFEKLRSNGAPAVVPQPALTLETSAPGYRARLLLEDLSLEWEMGKTILHHFKADLLFHRTR